MSIPDAYRTNFNTLLKAAQNGDLCLAESRDAKTGEPRYLICAVFKDAEDMINIVPFGHLCNGNPFEEYLDPTLGDLDATDH